MIFTWWLMLLGGAYRMDICLSLLHFTTLTKFLSTRVRNVLHVILTYDPAFCSITLTLVGLLPQTIGDIEFFPN